MTADASGDRRGSRPRIEAAHRTTRATAETRIGRTLGLGVVLAGACVPAPAPEAAPADHWPEGFPPPTPMGLEEFVPVPAANPLTRAKAELGRRLFFDPVLSRDSSVACASCHRPALAFADTLRVSPGLGGRAGSRNTPSLLNRAYGRSFFWDGRIATLEAAVLVPIPNPVEMGLPVDSAAARIAGSPAYGDAVRAAFPGEGMTRRTLAFALASYIRVLRSAGSPVDRHGAGDPRALSPAAARGRRIFAGKGSCFVCHLGPNLTDERFHNTGVSFGGDPGRMAATGREAERARFKTPTLRNVARTPPYMHDGSLATLEEVVAFYDRGGGPNPGLDPEIRPLGLSAPEQRDLVAFLRALTGPPWAP